jgi:hypothetical protein
MGISTFSQKTVSAGFSSPSGFGNVIINGAFDIWQRGISGSANGGFLADRWTTFSDAGGTTSQQAFTPGSAPVAGYEGSFFLRVARTAGGTFANVIQKIEDVRTFAGQTFTISFWAKASVAQTLTIRPQQVFGSGGSSNEIFGFSEVAVTTSWQRFSATVTAPSLAGKTIGTNSHLYFELYWLTAAAMSMDIWGIQLEAGAVATPFRRNAPSIQAELDTCQRYFQRFLGGTGCSASGIGSSANAVILSFSLPTPMRTTVSANISGQIRMSDQYFTDLIASTATLDVLQGATNLGGRIVVTGFSEVVTGRFYSIPGNGTGSGFIDFSAEL